MSVHWSENPVTVATSRMHYYGAGTYFASDSCKASQYPERTKVQILLLSRVMCGDPFYTKMVMHGERRPPERETGSSLLYDTVVANPGEFLIS